MANCIKNKAYVIILLQFVAKQKKSRCLRVWLHCQIQRVEAGRTCKQCEYRGLDALRPSSRQYCLTKFQNRNAKPWEQFRRRTRKTYSGNIGDWTQKWIQQSSRNERFLLQRGLEKKREGKTAEKIFSIHWSPSERPESGGSDCRNRNQQGLFMLDDVRKRKYIGCCGG